MVGHVKPVGIKFLQCLAEVTPGELKEGYMDVASCCLLYTSDAADEATIV